MTLGRISAWGGSTSPAARRNERDSSPSVTAAVSSRGIRLGLDMCHLLSSESCARRQGWPLSHDRPSSRAGSCIRPGQASWLVPRRGLTVAGQHRVRTGFRYPNGCGAERSRDSGAALIRGARENGWMFDLDEFVADCRVALAETDRAGAVRELLERAGRERASIVAALGQPGRGRLEALHHAPDLTVLNVVSTTP